MTGGSVRTSAALLFSAGLLAGPAVAATADEELARRTFDNAEQLMREGKIEQALRDFEQVSNAYPESGVADDALYRMGSYYYPIESVQDLGTSGETAIARARDLFGAINSRHPSEDKAPRALLKLGLLALDPGNRQRNLDEAYANFYSIPNIYPDSDVVDQGLFGAGYADLIAGRYDKSIALFERVAERYSRGRVAEDARYYMAMAYVRKGEFIRALEELQAVRDLYPGGRLSEPALDRMTQIYKLRVRPEAGMTPIFVQDSSYFPDLGLEAGPIALAVDAGSVMHVLNARTGSLARLGHDGTLKSTGPPFLGAVNVWVDEAGVEILAAGDRVRAGMEVLVPLRVEGNTTRGLRRISAAVRRDWQSIAVLNAEHDEILVYSGDAGRPRLMFRDVTGKSRLVGLAAGAEGMLYTIDRRNRVVVQIEPNGTLREIPFPSELDAVIRNPEALAADDLGNLYILDGRSNVLVVMTVEGEVIQKIASRPGTAGDFNYATAIAVGPRAEIYVYDEKRRAILRYF